MRDKRTPGQTEGDEDFLLEELNRLHGLLVADQSPDTGLEGLRLQMDTPQQGAPAAPDRVAEPTASAKGFAAGNAPLATEGALRRPGRAEIEHWIDLAVEARLQPLRQSLKRELMEELLRRYPDLRE